MAEKLNRKWIGVDISHLAVKLILDRLTKPYELESQKDKVKQILTSIEVNGFPKDIAAAKELAAKTDKGRFKFQDWVVEFLLGGVSNPKKTADGAWDGYCIFPNPRTKKNDVVLIEVKSGKTNVRDMRNFCDAVETENASMGVFVCFEENITKEMLLKAKEKGYYEPEFFAEKYDKVQILSLEKILKGETMNRPDIVLTTFMVAQTKLQIEIPNEKIF